MNTLITTTNTQNTEATMTHLQIAELTGVRNDSVKRSMETLANRGVISVTQSVERLKFTQREVFNVTERDSYIVVAQLYPEFTAKLVDYWMSHRDSQPKALPQTFAEALQLAADQAKQIEEQQQALQAAAPKVETYERVMSLEKTMTIRDAAKHLNFHRQQDFFVCLQGDGYLLRQNKTWKASQKSIKAGLMEHKQTPFGLQATITMKGLEVFSKRYDF